MISVRHRRNLAIAVITLSAWASAGAMPGTAAPRPQVKFIKVPTARTSATAAEFRFRTRADRTWCRRDNLRYRRCRLRVKYTNLAPGRHTFTVRARHRGRTTFARRHWTILAAGPASRAAPAPAVGAAGAPAAAGTAAGGEAEAQAGAAAAPDAAAPPAQVPVGLPQTEAPPAAPDEGGIEPPVNPAPRKLIFADEFNGTSLDPALWDIYDGPGHDNNGSRRPSAFSLDGRGNLVVTGKMVNSGIVSGGMGGRLNFTYGRVEFRVRTEPDPTGTMSAVVMTWPKEQLAPEFTENDIYETGIIPDNTYEFSTFIHFGTNNWQKWFTHQVDPTQWHTIAMEWQPDALEIFVDGSRAFTITDPAVIPDVLHHVCIQLDARATRPLSRAVRLFVDYIRVWQ